MINTRLAVTTFPMAACLWFAIIIVSPAAWLARGAYEMTRFPAWAERMA